MKKLIVSFILASAFLISINSVDASSATISTSANRSTVIVGQNVRVTVRVSSSSNLGSWSFDVGYDSSALRIVNSPMGGGRVVDVTNNPSTKSKTYTFDFKAKKSGSTTISIRNANVIGYNEQVFSVNPRGITLNLMTQAQLEATFSKNNYLKSLTVEGAELSPSFDKGVEEYEVTLEPETREVTIGGSREDSTASVEGFGTFDVNDGTNPFEVVVSAQNGNIRTYKINVIVEELDPIFVEIDGDSYTIVRKSEEIECYDNFDGKQIEYEGEEIPVCYNEVSDLTLVSLRNEDGEILSYVFDSDSFYEFNNINLEAIMFYYMDFPIDMEIPENYSRNKRTIDGIEYDVLVNRNDRDFGLIYGVNILTGEEGVYQYDFLENTIQRFDLSEDSSIDLHPVTIALSSLLIISSGFNIYFVFKDIKKGNRKLFFKKKSS